MNVKEMTNEELAVYFFNAAEGGTTLFMRCLRDAATRLRDLKPCNKNFKCDSLEELLTAEKRKTADLRRRMKVAEDALEKITTGSFSHKAGDKPIVQVIIDIARDAFFEVREEGWKVK